jgi:hypothetical protein
VASYEFKPISEDDLPQVAKFLYEQQEINSRDDSTQARPLGDDLRWMLRNPDRPDGAALGDSLRGPDGQMAGMIIAVPRLYLLGDRKLIGLAAGHFYIESAARMQGFFMLRRFFKLPNVDFYFANSCNRQSAPLWAKCGALLVSESDVEYLYPFHFGPLAEEIAERKQLPKPVGALLKALGPGADLIAGLRTPRSRFRIEPTVDLEKLAGLAEHNRHPDLLQPSRSLERLGWQYGNPPVVGKEGQGRNIYSFTSSTGDEGWFTLEYGERGARRQIRNAALLDVVWPETRLPFVEILPAIIAAARPFTDLISIRGRAGFKLDGKVPQIKRRALLSPEAYVLSQRPPASELVNLADFPYIERY